MVTRRQAENMPYTTVGSTVSKISYKHLTYLEVDHEHVAGEGGHACLEVRAEVARVGLLLSVNSQ